MRPRTEGEMTGGIPATHIEVVGVLEHLRIAVRGHVHQINALPLLH